MGKGKKGRRRKKVRPVQAPQSFAGLWTDIERATRAGRGRRAVTLAKRLQEREEFGPKHAAAVVAAHMQWLSELLTLGQIRRAETNFSSLVTVHPEWLPLFSHDFLLEMDLAGATDTILSRYGQEPQATVAIDLFLRARLRDIRPLADHHRLPAEHPLREQATLVLTAWEEIEDSAESGSRFRRMLQRVGRHSPLVHWRLFVQALEAAYRNNDDAARSALQRIPSDSAVAPMADILRDLIAGREPGCAAGRRIVLAMAGNDLHAQLATIDHLLECREWGTAQRSITELLEKKSRWTRYPGLRIEIGTQFAHRQIEADRPEDLRALSRLPGHTEMLMRGWARFGASDESDWIGFLRDNGRRLSAIERALLCDHIAGLAFQDAGGPFPPDIPWFDGESDEIEYAESWWSKSVAACPLRETYAKWHKAMQSRDARCAEKVLEAWHRDFPTDETPLLGLIEACRSRGVFQKAMGHLKVLDQLARAQPAVETVRHYLIADNAVRHLRQRRLTKVRELAESIPAGAQSYLAVIREMLLAAADWDAADRREAYIERLRRLCQPMSIVLVHHHITERKAIANFPIPALVFPQAQESDLLVANFHMLTQVRDPLWGLGDLLIMRDEIAPALKTTGVSSEMLRDCLDHLAEIDRDLQNVSVCKLAWPLTANCIRRRDALLPVFLAYRAAILISSAWRRRGPESARRPLTARAKLCLRAAWKVASTSRRLSDVHFIETMSARIFPDDPFDWVAKLSEKRIEAILKTEAGNDSDPTERTVGSGTRRRGPKNPRAASDASQARLF